MKKLLIGIKKRVSRKEGISADDGLRVASESIKKDQTHECYYCGFLSKSNENHHLDKKNQIVICQLCLPYHHMGDLARSGIALIRVSASYEGRVSAQNLNHLMRVIGMALGDEKEAPIAKEIYAYLVDSDQLKHFADLVYGVEVNASRVNPSELAQGMAHLTQDEYERRGDYVSDVRVVYHPAFLSQMGVRLSKEIDTRNEPTQWADLLEKEIEKTRSMINESAVSSSSVESQSISEYEDSEQEGYGYYSNEDEYDD